MMRHHRIERVSRLRSAGLGMGAVNAFRAGGLC